MQIANQLDTLHRRYEKFYWLYVAPFIIFGFGFIAGSRLNGIGANIYLLMMLFGGSSIVYAANRMSKLNRTYQDIYKNAFVISVLNQTFSDVRVNWEMGFTRQNIEQMGILKLGNRFDSEDLIHGTYEGVSFEQSDVTVENVTGSGENRHTTTYFKGRVFVFDIQKSDIRSVGIRSKDFQYYGNLNGIHHEPVQLESEAFNRQFQVVANNPVDAFYILTPQAMECVTDLYQRAGNVAMRYLGRKLYVAVNTKGNAFDGDIKKPFVYVDEINKIKRDCSVIVDIIQRLRIGDVQ